MLLSSASDTRSVNLSVLRSYYPDCDDAFYHVHPELLELDRASGAASARLCSICGAASKKPSATPPQTSLAAGCDYGLFSRMGPERPSALEALVFADVRTYSLTAKVHVPGQWCAARTLLRGHMFAFVHEGPSTVSLRFDEARVTGALQHF